MSAQTNEPSLQKGTLVCGPHCQCAMQAIDLRWDWADPGAETVSVICMFEHKCVFNLNECRLSSTLHHIHMTSILRHATQSSKKHADKVLQMFKSCLNAKDLAEN